MRVLLVSSRTDISCERMFFKPYKNSTMLWMITINSMFTSQNNVSIDWPGLIVDLGRCVCVLQGPVVKQAPPPAPKSSPSSPVPKQSPREKPADSPVTNEQNVVPSISTSEVETKEKEPNDDDEQKLTVDLKNPSACKSMNEFVGMKTHSFL